MKHIVLIPNPVLTNPAKTVTVFDKKLSTLISDMKETLIHTRNPKGVGLAAPQIGVALRVFVMKPTDKAEVRAFVNPEILEKSALADKKASDGRLEGCLSIPAVWGKVDRSFTVRLAYQDETGAKHEENLTGFPAVIVQHETDHLDGVLFTQRVIEQNGKIYQTTQDPTGKEVLEEIKI
jgi:peptide deformylase